MILIYLGRGPGRPRPGAALKTLLSKVGGQSLHFLLRVMFELDSSNIEFAPGRFRAIPLQMPFFLAVEAFPRGNLSPIDCQGNPGFRLRSDDIRDLRCLYEYSEPRNSTSDFRNPNSGYRNSTSDFRNSSPNLPWPTSCSRTFISDFPSRLPISRYCMGARLRSRARSLRRAAFCPWFQVASVVAHGHVVY